jgi:endonuclease YncB( thermonuclease family)
VDWQCGAVATGWLASRTLLKEVECRPTRMLSGGGYRAQCYVDGTDIAASGLGQGMYALAGPEQEYPPPGYAEIEAKAKVASAGLWSSEFMKPAEWRRAHGTYNPLTPQR